jgi:integration host factor subunit beta
MILHSEVRLNKSDLQKELAKHHGITVRKAEEIVDLVFGAMSKALARGEHIEIRGFGSFAVKDYRGCTGRNPKTGKPTVVKPKRLPFFKCGKELREGVNVR